MAWRWLQKLVGVDSLRAEMEARIRYDQMHNTSLEGRVIEANQALSVIRDAALEDTLSEQMNAELAAHYVRLAKRRNAATKRALQAVNAVQEYALRRYEPPAGHAVPRAVITIADLQAHPELYLAKLSKGALNFPLGLNFDAVNSALFSLFGNVQIDTTTTFSNNGVVTFVPQSILTGYGKSSPANALVHETLSLADLDRGKKSTWAADWVSVDTLDFLANYDGIRRLISENPDLSDAQKTRGLSALGMVHSSYVTALELLGSMRIRDSHELLIEQQSEETPAIANASLEHTLRRTLLSNLRGTTYDEVQRLLPIRSRDTFRRLANERTAEMLSADRQRKGFTALMGKDISDYGVGESILLACYFTRNIISGYESLDDGVKRAFQGGKQDGITGKCTDFTGLALHYLREYLVPLQPEKFAGWQFGFDADTIDNYRHSYLKAVHERQDGTIDVYFLDPTDISKKGIGAFKTPKDLAKKLDASRLPLELTRDAEDLLRAPIA